MTLSTCKWLRRQMVLMFGANDMGSRSGEIVITDGMSHRQLNCLTAH